MVIMEEKKKKKMGRPTDNPRNQRMSLKLTVDEMSKLKECSEILGEPRVNVISKGIEKIYNQLKEK